jgi:hypothetical protein
LESSLKLPELTRNALGRVARVRPGRGAAWIALLLAAASFPAPAQRASATWTPNDISVSRSVPGEPASASTRFEVAPDGDARIAIERRDGSSRTTGTILLIGGRWMLTRGFGVSADKEIESLDLAVLDSQLVVVLLTAALPDGPPAPGPPQHVRFAEKTNPIRMSTASTSVEYQAPWTVVGTVTVPAAGAAANYQLSFTWSDRGTARTVDFAGSAGNAKSVLDLPDSMKLTGWKIRRVPQSLESSLEAAQPDAAAQTNAQKAVTLGELRRLP